MSPKICVNGDTFPFLYGGGCRGCSYKAEYLGLGNGIEALVGTTAKPQCRSAADSLRRLYYYANGMPTADIQMTNGQNDYPKGTKLFGRVVSKHASRESRSRCIVDSD